MSYTVTITGDDPTVEADLIEAYETFIDNVLSGELPTVATFTDAAGTVTDLLPPPVTDPKAELDDAIKTVDDLLAPLASPAGGSVTLTAEDAAAILTAYAELQTAAADYEASVASSGNASAAPAPIDAGAPVSDTSGSSVTDDHEARAALNAVETPVAL